MKLRKQTIGAYIVSGLACIASSASANSYQIADIGIYYPAAINNMGEVIGNDGNPGKRGLIYRDHKWHRLSPQSEASALNDAGYVVGRLENLEIAAMWKPRGALKKIDPPSFGRDSRALAINIDNVIVGDYLFSTLFCFIKSPGKKIRSMGFLPGGNVCSPSAINIAGKVTGAATIAGGAYHAFIWEDGVFQDLGVLAGTRTTEGLAINSAGMVVGLARIDSDDSKAFLWNGAMVNLAPNIGYNQSAATAINASETIVGWAKRIGEQKSDAVRFDPGGNLAVPLENEISNLEDWNLIEATGINDAGQIVGYGVRKSTGETRGFELTPN